MAAPWLGRNAQLGKPLKLSSWRKIALGTWQTAGDPSVYGILELDAEPATKYIEELREKSGKRVTMTHLVGRVLGEVLKRHPQINCIMRFGRLYPRKNVDIFFQVATDTKGEDLSGMTIRNIDQKSMVDIGQEMEDRVAKIRSHKDQTFKKTKQTMGLMPGWLSGFLLDLTSFILYTLNIYWKPLGAPRDAFGSAMVTNIGSLGLDLAFAPLVPYSKVPLLLAVGATQDQPVVENGQIKVGKKIKICATFDHRLIDGVHAAHMANSFTKIFLNPKEELG